MINSNTDIARYVSKIREQIRFLERSCSMYDRGAEDESLRIATSLRILFHDTKNSTSLINHLNFASKKALSSAKGYGDWKDYLAIKIDLSSPQPVQMLPCYGEVFVEISIRDWWENETIHDNNGQKHTRRNLVLSAVNKDGGAHVDSTLEPYYEVLCSGQPFLCINGDLTYDGPPPFQQGLAIYPNNAHLALIRQFAHETLTSISHFDWLA